MDRKSEGTPFPPIQHPSCSMASLPMTASFTDSLYPHSHLLHPFLHTAAEVRHYMEQGVKEEEALKVAGMALDTQEKWLKGQGRRNSEALGACRSIREYTCTCV